MWVPTIDGTPSTVGAFCDIYVSNFESPLVLTEYIIHALSEHRDLQARNGLQSKTWHTIRHARLPMTTCTLQTIPRPVDRSQASITTSQIVPTNRVCACGYRTGSPRRQFCTLACRQSAARARRLQWVDHRRHQRTCSTCGKSFIGTPSASTCSSRCRQRRYRDALRQSLRVDLTVTTIAIPSDATRAIDIQQGAKILPLSNRSPAFESGGLAGGLR